MAMSMSAKPPTAGVKRGNLAAASPNALSLDREIDMAASFRPKRLDVFLAIHRLPQEIHIVAGVQVPIQCVKFPMRGGGLRISPFLPLSEESAMADTAMGTVREFCAQEERLRIWSAALREVTSGSGHRALRRRSQPARPAPKAPSRMAPGAGTVGRVLIPTRTR